MLKSVKMYFALCLIGLQFIAPFIHAHAFGLDTLEERTVHIHANVATPPSTANMQMDVALQQQVGYVVTVASGVAPQAADLSLSPLLGFAVFLCFALLFAAQSTSVVFHSLPPPFFKRHLYTRTNPRAPPCPLNHT